MYFLLFLTFFISDQIFKESLGSFQKKFLENIKWLAFCLIEIFDLMILPNLFLCSLSRSPTELFFNENILNLNLRTWDFNFFPTSFNNSMVALGLFSKETIISFDFTSPLKRGPTIKIINKCMRMVLFLVKVRKNKHPFFFTLFSSFIEYFP